MTKRKSDTGQLSGELKKIVAHLLLNSHLCTTPGLYYGKTGIAIFFFHVYNYTLDETLEERGFQLLTEIQPLIHEHFPLDYSTGLSGIGAGIEYLCRNGLVKGDSNEILEDFDKRILQTVTYIPHRKFHIPNGLCGLGKYLICRKISQQEKYSRIGKEMEQAIVSMLDLIDYRINNELLRYKLDYLDPVWRDVLSFLKELSIYDPSDKCTELVNILIACGIKSRKRIKFPEFGRGGRTDGTSGLYEGYAGRGLFLLEKLDKSVKKWNCLL
jgi:hypothetical protein